MLDNMEQARADAEVRLASELMQAYQDDQGVSMLTYREALLHARIKINKEMPR